MTVQKTSILVTGADALFGELLIDCVRSARAVGYEGAIAVLDFGLSDTQKTALMPYDVRVLAPEIPEAYQILIDKKILKGPRGANVLLMKPYLPEILPDYDHYLFVDADCWFQTNVALEALHRLAGTSDFVAVSQRSRYHEHDGARGNGVEFNILGQPLRRNWYTMFANKSKLPKADKQLLAAATIINAGVFSAPRLSPIWQAWRDEMYRCVLALPPRRKYGADQLGLGLALYKNQIAPLLLPEICNWHSSYRYDRIAKQFTQTMPFYEPVSLMHLAGVHPHETTRPVLLEDGTTETLDLTYAHWQANR